MGFSTLHSNLNDIKELLIFYNTLDNLPEIINKKFMPPKKGDEETIDVILSADNTYAPLIAVTGASILYNTLSPIHFHILSDGISQSNIYRIIDTFNSLRDNVTIDFIEVDHKKFFSYLNLRKDYLSLATCNRLLIPMLLPQLEKAIYLDVDLIVRGDIKELWHENLNGACFGAVPVFAELERSITALKKNCKIPLEEDFLYLNSGVLLMDFKRWREVAGENLTQNLLNICVELNPPNMPDEIVLNRFAYLNGYAMLPAKYNVNSQYAYDFLKKYAYGADFYFNMTKFIEQNKIAEKDWGVPDDIFIMHWWGASKPWKEVFQKHYGSPMLPKFADFWFYAKMTKFFNEFKFNFIYYKVENINYQTPKPVPAPPEDEVVVIKRDLKRKVLVGKWVTLKMLSYILPFMKKSITKKIEANYDKIRQLHRKQ